MKKELLLASALASTVGMAGIAEAASATFSGHVRAGVEGEDPDSATDSTTSAPQLPNFNVSISETTDAGMTIATGFTLADEGGAEADVSGLTLTFTDGSSLQLIEAGSASDAHDVSVPSASGEQGVANTSTNNSATGLVIGAGNDNVGFDYATAADAFGIEGFSANVSASFNSDVATTSGTGATVTVENSYAVGVTYVTTAGDSTVTVGAGYHGTEYNNPTPTTDGSSYHMGATVVTGDLTVGAGYADGDWVSDIRQHSGSYAAAGAEYVSGDITFNIGVSAGDGIDEAIGTAATSQEDSYDTVGASVDYVIASGVTGTLGYTQSESKDDGTDVETASGSAWYVGATVSF